MDMDMDMDMVTYRRPVQPLRAGWGSLTRDGRSPPRLRTYCGPTTYGLLSLRLDGFLLARGRTR